MIFVSNKSNSCYYFVIIYFYLMPIFSIWLILLYIYLGNEMMKNIIFFWNYTKSKKNSKNSECIIDNVVTQALTTRK